MDQFEDEKINQSVLALLQEFNIPIQMVIDDANGKRLFLRSTGGIIHECLVRHLNLDNARSIKILKSDFDNEINECKWIILGLTMDQMRPVFYMIPLTVFKTPDRLFIDNNQPPRLSHMSNWEIKIYLQAIPELSKYSFESSASLL